MCFTASNFCLITLCVSLLLGEKVDAQQTDEGLNSLVPQPLTTAYAEPLPREKPLAKRTVEEIYSREKYFKQLAKSKFEMKMIFV